MERAVEFLVTELKVCTQKEAKERTFFVSAGEALQARLQEQKGLPADSKNNELTVGSNCNNNGEQKRCMDSLGHIFVRLIGVDR
jgi:hypothetical protein